MQYKQIVLPGIQMQWKPPIWSRQVASLWQGLDMHSLTSISQRGPSYPWRHLHWKEPWVLRQRPPCSQGLAPKTFKVQDMSYICGHLCMITVKYWIHKLQQKKETTDFITYQGNTHQCPGCRLTQCNLGDRCRLPCHWLGLCHNLSPFDMGCWCKHHQGGTANLWATQEKTFLLNRVIFNYFIKIMIYVHAMSGGAADSRTCAPMRALAEEGGDTVVAGSTMVTSCAGTVIDVLTAVVTCPPVDTDAVVAAVSVMTRSSVLACIGHQLTLIHIFCAVLAWEKQSMSTIWGKVDKCYLCIFLIQFSDFMVILLARSYLCNEVGTDNCRCSHHPRTHHHSGSCGLDSHQCYAHSADRWSLMNREGEKKTICEKKRINKDIEKWSGNICFQLIITHTLPHLITVHLSNR